MYGLYNIYIDGKNHQIKIVVDNEHCKDAADVALDCLVNDSLTGSGELHHKDGFAEVMNVLSGEIKFYAIDKGPLWIIQDTCRVEVRYLIAPALVYAF